MYAPLPSEMHVVVRAPGSWTRLGLIPPGTFWTLRRAVYGLRQSPKAWGDLFHRPTPSETGVGR